MAARILYKIVAPPKRARRNLYPASPKTNFREYWRGNSPYYSQTKRICQAFPRKNRTLFPTKSDLIPRRGSSAAGSLYVRFPAFMRCPRGVFPWIQNLPFLPKDAAYMGNPPRNATGSVGSASVAAPDHPDRSVKRADQLSAVWALDDFTRPNTTSRAFKSCTSLSGTAISSSFIFTSNSGFTPSLSKLWKEGGK